MAEIDRETKIRELKQRLNDLEESLRTISHSCYADELEFRPHLNANDFARERVMNMDDAARRMQKVREELRRLGAGE